MVKQGLTLLELMIAIAIIGVLISIALPAFYRYTYKNRVAELLVGASPAIIAVNDHVAANAQTGAVSNFPPSSQPGPENSYVANIATDSNGIITITGTAETGPDSPTIITYTPTLDTAGNISWKCSSSPASNQKYAPENCQ